MAEERQHLLERSKLWRTVLVLGLVGIFVGAGIKTVRKAMNGRTAFVRWTPATEAVQRGEMIYYRGGADEANLEEGFPTSPLMLVILMPFHALWVVAGSVLLQSASSNDIFGDVFGSLAQAYGAYVIAALLLFVGCGLGLQVIGQEQQRV